MRRSVVLHALLWLKQHNKYYHDVTIDMEEVKQLPIDGNLSNITTIEDAAIKIEDKKMSDKNLIQTQYNSMAVSRGHSNKRVCHRRIHLLCLPYIVSHW